MKTQICPSCNSKIKPKRVAKPRRKLGHVKFASDKALKIEMKIRELLKTDAHYTLLANEILKLHMATGYSERRMASLLEISKSEVHRLFVLAFTPYQIREAAITYGTEKYVLLEWEEIKNPTVKETVRASILNGNIRKRLQLKKYLAKTT